LARTARFREAATRLGDRTGVPEQTARHRLLALLTAAQAAAGTELSATDCTRFLDALVLATLSRA
jgi:hypothetical protein